VLVPLGDGTARIDPATLVVDHDGPRGVDSWSAASPTALGTPTAPVVTPTSARWGFDGSDLTVVASEQQGRLSMVLTAGSEEVVAWPVTAGPDVRSVEFPNGEGLSVPVTDAFWASDEAGLTEATWDFAGGLTMPFWGATLDDRGVSYLVVDDIGTTLAFREQDGRLAAIAEHTFSSGRGTGTYEVLLSPQTAAWSRRRGTTAAGCSRAAGSSPSTRRSPPPRARRRWSAPCTPTPGATGATPRSSPG
jgi:hypothetical protein